MRIRIAATALIGLSIAGPVRGQQLALTGESDGDRVDGFNESIETKNLIIYWRWSETTSDEARAVAELGQSLYEKIAAYLGPAAPRPDRIIVMLQGAAERPSYRYRFPHVDVHGRVHMFRYEPEDGGYTSSLAHELVHAMRRPFRRHYDGFIEEGFATHLANVVRPVDSGFPNYGFPPHIVAAHWIVRDEGIPLRVLKDEHDRWSVQCKAQSYTVRGSFFTYLEDRFGRRALLRLVDGGGRGTYAWYEEVFGRSFDALEKEWLAWTRNRFEADPRARELADRYRTGTSVRHWPVCRPGQGSGSTSVWS